MFETKGDANDTADPWQVQATDTDVWRVRAVVPGLGFGIHWLRAPGVQVVGVFVLPALVALWWVVGIWREDDADLDAVTGAAR